MPDTSAAGRSADKRGKIWQKDTADVWRLWYPGAGHVGSYHAPGLGDITGVGDRIIECTVQPMSALAAKLRQAEADALRGDLGEYYVVKKAAREPARRAYAITRLEVLVPLLARLDKLDQWEAEQAATREALG